MPRKYYCTYVEETQRIWRLLGTEGGHDIQVIHDSWCPILGGDGRKQCKPQYRLDGVPIQPPSPDADVPPAVGNTLVLSDHDADGVLHDEWHTDVIEAGTEIVGTFGGRALKVSTNDPPPGKAACMYCLQYEERMRKATHIVEYIGALSVPMCADCAADVQGEIDAGTAVPGCSVRMLRA